VKEIYAMARKSYRGKMGKPEELYDMVHTENLVLVDTKKESSWFYDGKKEDIVRLIEDINFLNKFESFKTGS
jgi:protein SCO1/2